MGMTEARLEFLSNEGGEGEGLSDAGIETFRENPFAAVAREIGQNSRDARGDETSPVRITFDILELDTEDFPAIEDYRTAAEVCLKKSKASSKEKEIGFFQNACRVLNKDTIRILRISDFNTKGVRGPCVEGNPFHTLAKTDGVSDKEDIGSLGSFGIGKNAPFALSDIQTVFYSTRYSVEDADHNLCMGKTQFISHVDASRNEKRRKGYWGNPDGFMPLKNGDDIPEWLKRAQQGTSIYAIGMRQNPTDWRFEMSVAILINFFSAVQRGEMEFELDDGKIKINQNTIKDWFNAKCINEAVDVLNVRVAFDSAKTLHLCLIDTDTHTETILIEGLGRVNVHMLMREGLGYTIGIVRSGMYITDNFKYFNEPFSRFPLHRDFAVVIEPVEQTESAWFKRLENPRHDNLSADRITDPEMRAKGQALFEKLAKEVRDIIRSNAKAQPSDSIELDELNDFFVSEESRETDPEGIETEPEKKEPTPVKRVKPKKTKPVPQPDGEPDDPPGPGPKPGPTPPGPKPRPRRIMLPVELISDRVLVPDLANAAKRRILFTPENEGTLNIYTDATGLSSEVRLIPLSVSWGKIVGEGIEVDCTSQERVSVDVVFDSDYSGPVELSAYRKDESEPEVEDVV